MVFLSLFCMVFLFSISNPPALCLNQEGLALLSFKTLIQEDPEASLSNWNFSDEYPCSWNGITCKDFKVISISIPQKRLLGFLPSVLGSLSNLRHINLRSNKLHGSLPAELFDGQSTQSLVFYGNSSNGSLPTGVGKLSYLQTLDLSENFFNGSIPISILQCRRLKTLDLSHNNFTGPLPVGFGASLIVLEKLDLSYNQLNGSVPSDFGNLSSLQGTVDLSHNLFSGPIPAGLGNLPEKVYIDLTYNNLSGPIPQSGALVNRGPTAFVGNLGLCGPPLKNPCSSDRNAGIPTTLPYIPKNQLPVISDDNSRGDSSKGKRSLSTDAVTAIVMSDIVGIGLIALVFLSCYWRAVRRNGKDDNGNSEKGKTGQKACSCFRKDASEAISENVEQLDLVPLDSHVGFDLDELLKSPAFVLGKSRIGIMYKVVLDDGRTLAVRRFGEGGLQRFKEFRAEVETIGKVRHPNIVTLRAYYWSADEKLIVYDYMTNGNLAAAIHGKAGMASFLPMPWLVRLEIMKGIAKGLAYLHEFSPKKYVHGDLKSTNILLGPNMEPHISDFGLGRLAKIAGESPAPQSNRISAEKWPTQPLEVSVKSPTKLEHCYQAPEALKLLKPSQKWDVYSFGVILLELISGRSPMVVLGTPDMDLVTWVRTHIEEKKPLSEVLDPCLTQELDSEEEMASVTKIALSCVHANAERRPSMRHVSDALDRLRTNSQERSTE